jgi:hypothetical protein
MLIYRQGGRGRGLSQAKQPVQRHIRQSLADAAAHSLSPTPSIKKKKKIIRASKKLSSFNFD